MSGHARDPLPPPPSHHVLHRDTTVVGRRVRRDMYPGRWSAAVFALLTAIIRPLVQGTEISTKEHKTQGATILKNDLSCYTCDTAQDGPNCHNLSLNSNPGIFIKKCQDDKRQCVVKKISYQVNTENATNKPKLWSLQRNCTAKCDHGCISIGERTKLLACTYCCNSNGCNSMMGKSPSTRAFPILLYLMSVLIPIQSFLSM